MLIDYNIDKNSFIISCGFSELDIVRSIPNKRFNKKTKLWTCPCFKLNVIFLKELLNDKTHIFTKKSKSVINDYDGLPRKKQNFPSHYKFKFEPRKYQLDGLNYIYSLKKSALFMAMGTGKSKMVIDLMSCRYIENNITCLAIVCPCSIRSVWLTQLKEHCVIPYQVEILQRKNFKKIDFMIRKKTNKLKILIAGVESLQLKEGKLTTKFGEFTAQAGCSVVVDEAHDIKNPNSNRSKNLVNLTKNCNYKIAMTGTPISQSVLDLYGIFNFLDEDILGIGDFWSFKNRYTITQDLNLKSRTIKQVVGYKNVDELTELITPFTYQVTKELASKELPPKIKMVRFCEMTKEQKKIYDDIKKKKTAELKTINSDDIKLVYNHVLSMYVALQQVTGGFLNSFTGGYDDSGNEIKEIINIVSGKNNPKIKELKKIVDELDDNEQVIIWAKYRHEVFTIVDELKGYKTSKFEMDAVFYMDKTDDEKLKIKTDMNNKKIRYFVSTPNSGATGLTLNTVCYVIYYSNSERLLLREQSEDRCHRIGQKRTVTYFDLVCEGTVDEKIADCLSEKKHFSDYVKENLQKYTN